MNPLQIVIAFVLLFDGHRGIAWAHILIAVDRDSCITLHVRWWGKSWLQVEQQAFNSENCQYAKSTEGSYTDATCTSCALPRDQNWSN